MWLWVGEVTGTRCHSLIYKSNAKFGSHIVQAIEMPLNCVIVHMCSDTFSNTAPKSLGWEEIWKVIN